MQPFVIYNDIYGPYRSTNLKTRRTVRHIGGYYNPGMLYTPVTARFSRILYIALFPSTSNFQSFFLSE